MKVKIFKYEVDGQTCVDPYREDEKITDDYSDAKLFEFTLEESEIVAESKKLLVDHDKFSELLKSVKDFGCELIEIAHCLVYGSVYLGDFKELINKAARDEIISCMMHDLRHQVLTENKKEIDGNS